jgi:hypothetical protein
VTDFVGTFEHCRGLISVPVGIFDYNRMVISFEQAFSMCNNLTGESPYTLIDGVKYHLYERHKNPDEFVAPSGHSCFRECTRLSDYTKINNNSWN